MTTTRASTRQYVQLLFDRPATPIFRPKGPDATMAFDIPASYYSERYRPISDSVTTRGPGINLIPVTETRVPDISLAMSLDKRARFTVFNEYHRNCATNLINVLTAFRTVEEFTSACCYIQQRVNPYLYIYALSVSTLHRPDTRNIPIPSHVCTFPELYVDSVTLAEARQQGTLITTPSSRTPINLPVDYTGSDLDVEHRLAYYREDIGLNLHHWHWHLIYPLDGPDFIMNKDRRGEMFYYMHQQVLARYTFERFSNGLSRIAQFSNFREPIPESYFPKLDTLVASRVFPPRPANFSISNLNRESDQLRVDIADMERWRDRIYEAIHRGFLYRGNEQTPLTEFGGIDLLGNLCEANRLSINRNLYGNLHNMGHMTIGYCHDPDNRYLESYGAIGDPNTSMRDPIFYRFHAFINDIFEEHKLTLPPYTTQLNFDGVQVTGIEVRSQNATANNTFVTHWQTSEIDLSRGLDFAPSGAIFVSFTHLQHESFSYRITVQNNGAQRMGTVRIFMAPRLDERGVTFLFRDQRVLFVEMDKFTATLNNGSNTITRNSIQSSITVPFEQTFRSLDNRPPTDNTPEQEEFNFCGCGYPDHLLVPKGLQGEGLQAELFVMITDFQSDRVDDPTAPTTRSCDDAVSFCGLRNSRFPDAKPMGFPFDRMARQGINTLSQFLTPNMGVQQVLIRHENRTTRRLSAASVAATGTTQTASSTTTAAGGGAQRTGGQAAGRPQQTGQRGRGGRN